MSATVSLNYRNPTMVRKAGMVALRNGLGSVGATYFIRQFKTGYGDYTAERDKLHEGLTLEEIIANVRKIDEEMP